MAKVTFSLDDATVATLKRTAARHRKPQSWVVREAISEFGAKEDRLTAEEKTRMLEALERLRRAPITRTQADVNRELAEIRRSRRLSSLRRPVR